MNSKVRNKPRATRARDGRVKITSQGQVSIPRQVMRDAGLKPGDRLQARVDESGRVIFEPLDDLIMRFAGSATGLFEPGEIDRLRDEWDRSR